MPPPAKARSRGKQENFSQISLLELEDVEARVAVDDVDQPAAVDVDVVGLRAGLAGGGLGDEVADFLRRRRIGDVDDAQAAGEPRAVDERTLHVLLELVRAEAPWGRAAPG